MTLSARNLLLALGLFLATPAALAADPPNAEMAAAAGALASAERAGPQGPAAEVLLSARERFAQAEAAVARRKYKDAQKLAEQARALADLALARAQLIQARIEVEEKMARNAELRRQLLVMPERQP